MTKQQIIHFWIHIALISIVAIIVDNTFIWAMVLFPVVVSMCASCCYFLNIDISPQIRGLGAATQIAAGTYGIVISFAVAYSLIGWWGVIPNIVLFPLTAWFASPLKWILYGDYMPTLILYGGLFIGDIIKDIGGVGRTDIVEQGGDSLPKNELDPGPCLRRDKPARG